MMNGNRSLTATLTFLALTCPSAVGAGQPVPTAIARPGDGRPGTPSQPQPGQPQPGQPQPGLPGPGAPGGQVQRPPIEPRSPAPQPPGGPLGIPCPADGNPRKVTLRVTPGQIRSGTPVTLKVTVECPPKEQQRIDFSGAAPGVTDRGAGETFVSFINQIPRTVLQAGATSVETAFTPRNLASTVTFNLTAATDRPKVTSAPVSTAITGDGLAVATPTRVPTAPAGCTPTLTMNVPQGGVIGGANVTVNLTLSCSPPGGAVVQIITNPSSLLPGPPGGTVSIPAGQTSFQVNLQASRQGNGSATVRAALSQPPGGATPSHTVTITNNN